MTDPKKPNPLLDPVRPLVPKIEGDASLILDPGPKRTFNPEEVRFPKLVIPVLRLRAT